MANFAEVLVDLGPAGQYMSFLAHATRRWADLSTRLFDLEQSLDVAEATLASWQHKYKIQAYRPHSYIRALFGARGSEMIEASINSIEIVFEDIQSDINGIMSTTLQARRNRDIPNPVFDKDTVEDCLRRIQQNSLRSRQFRCNIFRKADHLETNILRLHGKLRVLERISIYLSMNKHASYFAGPTRLPDHQGIHTIGTGHKDRIQREVQEATTAQIDAEVLFSILDADDQIQQVHIELSHPQTHRLDFSLVVKLHGITNVILVRTVIIKFNTSTAGVHRDFAHAIPTLPKEMRSKSYLLPFASSPEGFEITSPPTKLMATLAQKEPLSAIARNENKYLGSQTLRPQDQCELAKDIVRASFHLLGSRWLDSLDCNNVRWRRTEEGKYISMLTAAPGSAAINRTLQRCLEANRVGGVGCDLTKHVHIFRVGLVLVEIALKQPISSLAFDHRTSTVKLYMNDNEANALDIASMVDLKANVFLGNMVRFCLSALQDQAVMADESIESAYFRYAAKEVDELKKPYRCGERSTSPARSDVGTPRTSRRDAALRE